MNYPKPLVEATLLRRYKRFLADVVLPGGAEVVAHIANPGSMRGFCLDRVACRVLRSDDPRRKLPWSVEQVAVGHVWASVNPGRANDVVAEALEARVLETLWPYDAVVREQRLGESRIDFRLDRVGAPSTWVEVKQVTLVEDDVARFPDAVTKRGARHLDELAEAVRRGERAAMLFVVARADGRVVVPADDIDPAYGHALRRAAAAGVELAARRCVVSPEGLRLGEAVPLALRG